jgi:hemoglobin
MYERLGGLAFFESLTARFYQGVAADEVLRPMYPDDLEAPRRHLCLFLAQFWGGPRLYEDERGSPRLRLRHLPFKVDQDARDRWLAHMRSAVEEAQLGALEKAQLLSYFEATANHLVNSRDD